MFHLFITLLGKSISNVIIADFVSGAAYLLLRLNVGNDTWEASVLAYPRITA